MRNYAVADYRTCILLSIVLFNEVLEVPYFLFVSLQCMFLLYSFLVLVKEFRDKLYYVVPLFPIVAQMNDNYFRWFIAVSFMLLSVRSFWWINQNTN